MYVSLWCNDNKEFLSIGLNSSSLDELKKAILSEFHDSSLKNKSIISFKEYIFKQIVVDHTPTSYYVIKDLIIYDKNVLSTFTNYVVAKCIDSALKFNHMNLEDISMEKSTDFYVRKFDRFEDVRHTIYRDGKLESSVCVSEQVYSSGHLYYDELLTDPQLHRNSKWIDGSPFIDNAPAPVKKALVLTKALQRLLEFKK